jgi:hypothetical protein
MIPNTQTLFKWLEDNPDEIEKLLKQRFVEQSFLSVLSTGNKENKLSDKTIDLNPKNFYGAQQKPKTQPKHTIQFKTVMIIHCDEIVNPEFDRLLEETAQKLYLDPIVLHKSLQDAWFNNRDRFDDSTLNILWEIEKLGGYSIPQLELIGALIRKNLNLMSSHRCMTIVKDKILDGYSFEQVIDWLILGIRA